MVVSIINKRLFLDIRCFCKCFHCCHSATIITNRDLSTHVANLVENKRSSTRAEWSGVIGLEIHAQIKSLSKLFSGASTLYGADTNSQVSFFDAALPGTLPVLNQRCVQAGVLTALALSCDINRVSKFDRKHYFYADLPAGYQITQQRQPLAVNGHVSYVYQCSHTSHTERKSARLIQLQLEQDSGKSLHDPENGLSLIDLNRAGVGLMEIVTAPDFRNGDEAVSFVRELRDILLTIDVCDGKMAEGSLRVDANISVHRPGEKLGVRTEVKNLNSFKSIRNAIEHEMFRHIDILESGGTVVNETRSFDVELGETVQMREKEKTLDYRFMPEPNLPPLVIHVNRAKDNVQLKSASSSSSSTYKSHKVYLEDVAVMMKELPDERRHRLEEEYNVSLLQSVFIVRQGLTGLFERLVNSYSCPIFATLFVLGNGCLPLVREAETDMAVCSFNDETLAEIIHLYSDENISGTSVSIIIQEKLLNTNKEVSDIIEEHSLQILSDINVIQAVIDDVFSRNPQIVKAFKKGKKNQLKILTGKVGKLLAGRASNATVNKLVLEKLEQ